MPNNKNERKGKQTGELSAEERFRNFFSTSVIDLPEEMTHRDAPAPVEEKPKAGLLGKLFGHDKEETPAAAQPVLEIPTGEILLGADAKPVQPEQEDMALELRTADPVPVMPLQFARTEPVEAVPAEPVPAPKAAAAVKPQPKKSASQPEPQPAAAPQKQPKAKNAPEILLPQEELEQREMQQLKDMLNGMSGKAKPAVQPAKPVQAAPQPKVQPAPAQPAAEPEKAPAKAAQKAAEELPPVVFASAPADPETLPKKPEKKSIFQMFGTAEDEKPAAHKPEKEDTMSLPLLPLEQDGAPAEPAPAPADAAPAAPTQPETAPEAAVPTEEAVPESTTDKLHHMAAELTLRCVLAGILAVVLLHLGLTAERLLPPLSVLDPDAAPAAFYAANLLLFAASLFVGYPVLRDGLTGLRGRPSADTMPALAAVAALLQAVVAMLNANAYRSTEGIGLLTGMAALGLFLALVGSRVMLAAVQGGYALAAESGELRGAYRTRDKDLIRALARDLEQKDPWVLLSRPVQAASDDFVEQSLSERASERRARKVACILLAAAVLSCVAFLLFGGGINCAVAAAAAVLCMGAPLSSVLVPGLAALRLQRAAAAVGAVVPGWAAIEELGGIDTIELDADDLFTADSVTLEDIRIFKGGRIDRAILYAASVLNESCDTLRGLFRQIIEDRTDILFPVKDLEQHTGLGFSAWCDNNRILIGTRRYMEQEGVTLPEQDYEDSHSKNGELQILYLAVSGNLHAMFVLRYVGGRNVARSLASLQRENIRLLVTSKDPSLTARHITEAYHLPEGMVTVLDGDQCQAIEAADAAPAKPKCCLYHHRGFASLTGGLQAADQAQNAETSATTVQLVSVCFSVFIAVLLTYAGSIWQLSIATVLMYQAAWSALSIAVCALKQHS
ncbi:cell envelope biogenesis protein OmpA [Faecalibacterium prausnitzii]|uniref:cell envelope biogenesis protein OmpA n=1 Tax=Faecalibacterium prausnitzii TaxID=853 RepID=UPI0029113B5F|nr:cell envelope biogenesis protein OmpA [Faecalibacterium prausnitzii]MDU8658327.1 cell envelope biogenesis protein OmpA [Faecalibacterium prausnitzii]